MTPEVVLQGKSFGPDKLFFIAGPCVLESEDLAMGTARQMEFDH